MNNITINSREVSGIDCNIGLTAYQPRRLPQQPAASTNLDLMTEVWAAVMFFVVGGWYIIRYGMYNTLKAGVVALGIMAVATAFNNVLNPDLYKNPGKEKMEALWILWAAFGAAFCMLMSWAGRPRHYRLQMGFVAVHFAAIIGAVMALFTVMESDKHHPDHDLGNMIALGMGVLYIIPNAIEMFANWRNANS